MENLKLVKELNDAGVDISLVIQESFLGYKYRKHNHQLYKSDSKIPTQLIRMYYSLNPNEIVFDKMKSAFIERYITNENMIEDVHSEEEKEGFKKMYEYIHSDDIEYLFDVYTMKDLHKQLFSMTPHPECAGDFRRHDVYLPGTGTELCEWSMIRPRLNELDHKVQYLREYAKEVKNSDEVDQLFDYLDQCVELKCALIKVHPFGDGNGRVVRGFINKLLEDANLPPVYIKSAERTEYHEAMNLANNEGNYAAIKNFYRYKICDSIIELDINDRVRKENKKQATIYNQKILKKV